MELNEYQEKAMSTRMESCDNLSYMLFGLQGEVGELSSKIAKLIRKGELKINDNGGVYTTKIKFEDVGEIEKGILSEIGDCAWFLAGLCSVFGAPLEYVAQMNLAKLASRQQRGVIDGNGDNR